MNAAAFVIDGPAVRCLSTSKPQQPADIPEPGDQVRIGSGNTLWKVRYVETDGHMVTLEAPSGACRHVDRSRFRYDGRDL